MSKILLGYTAIGPTYKDRVVYHIKKYQEHYKYFDVLILTNDPEYFKFDEIKDFSNVIIEDLNKHRQQFPEFLEYEKLAEEKIDDEKYRNEVVNLYLNGFSFPLHLQRFILNYKNIINYEGVIMLDCDVAPSFKIRNPNHYFITDNSPEGFFEYFQQMSSSSVSSNKACYNWDKDPMIKQFMLECINELNKENIKNLDSINGFDNPIKLLKFESGEKIHSFLKSWNHCLLKAFKSNYRNHVIHKAWGDASEIIIALLYNIENFSVNLDHLDYISMNSFKSYTYPEDRFWNDVTSLGFETFYKSRKEFISNNYQKLKEFYKNYGQEFPYE